MANFDAKELKIGGAFLASGQAVQAFIAFGVNLVLVRFLAPEDFGRFALVLAGATVVYSIFSLRINVLVIREDNDKLDAAAEERYMSALGWETIFSTLLIFTWILISGDIGNWEVGLIMAIGVRHWTDNNKAVFERRMPYRQLAAIETATATASHVLALVLVIGGMGWKVLFIREIFLSAALFAAFAFTGGLTFRRFRLLGIGEWKDLARDARGVWLDAVLEGSFQRVTILLAGLIGGERIAGFFFQAQRLAIVPNQFLVPIVSRIAGNWFVRVEDRSKRIAGRDRLLLNIFIPLLIGGILTYLFADPVVPWLFGEKWRMSAELFRMMAGLVVFQSLFETVKAYCWVVKQTRWLLIGRVFQYGGLLTCFLLGVTGAMEAAVALSLGLSVAYSLAFLVVYTILRFTERDQA